MIFKFFLLNFFFINGKIMVKKYFIQNSSFRNMRNWLRKQKKNTRWQWPSTKREWRAEKRTTKMRRQQSPGEARHSCNVISLKMLQPNSGESHVSLSHTKCCVRAQVRCDIPVTLSRSKCCVQTQVRRDIHVTLSYSKCCV